MFGALAGLGFIGFECRVQGVSFSVGFVVWRGLWVMGFRVLGLLGLI